MLLSSTQKLQVVLSGAITTSQLPLVAGWADSAGDASTLAPGSATAATNSTTAVDIVPAPAATFLRQLKYLSAYNADTVAATLTVRLDDGGTVRILCVVTLAVGSRLEYTAEGFRAFDSTGALVGSGGGGGSGDVVGPASATADAVALFNGTTGKLLKNGVTVASIRSVPQNSKSAAYTLVLADAGGHILHPSADTTARTFTIPANASVAFPIGTAVTFVNQNAAGVVTIAITTDTMRLAGAGTTGSRTLAANGIATALKITSTQWIINGTGLT